MDAEKATQPGAPQLHENAPNNVVFEWTVGDKDGTDAAFENAEVVVKQRLVNNRLIPNPMEVRGDIGWYNPGTDEYTIWMSSQTPHIQRLLLTAFVTGIPEHKVRCISPDVGGAFGTKIFCYADMALVMFASKLVGGLPGEVGRGPARELRQHDPRPRPHHLRRGRRRTKQGEVQGLRVKTFANLGGRLSTIGPGIPTTLYGRILAGPYKIPNVYAEVTGRLHQHHVRGRVSRRGPAGGDLRRRADDGPPRRRAGHRPGRGPAPQLPAAGRLPVRQPVRAADRGQRLEAVHRLGQLRAGDGQGARDGRLRRHRGEEGRGEGPRQAPGHRPVDLHRGLRRRALRSGSAPSARAGAPRCGSASNIKVHLTGKIVVTMGTQPQGQGHETTYAQIISHELGIPMDDIVVQHSDTQGTPFGYGSYGCADLERRHRRRAQGRRQDPREGAPLRGAHARGQRPTTSRSRATSTGSRARPRR